MGLALHARPLSAGPSGCSGRREGRRAGKALILFLQVIRSVAVLKKLSSKGLMGLSKEIRVISEKGNILALTSTYQVSISALADAAELGKSG